MTSQQIREQAQVRDEGREGVEGREQAQIKDDSSLVEIETNICLLGTHRFKG